MIELSAMKRQLLFLLSIIAYSFLLTGCVDVGNFYLTDEQETQVVDYSVNLLKKYNANSRSRLVDTTEQRLLDKRVEEYVAQKKAMEKTSPEDAADSKKEDGSDNSASNDPFAAAGIQDIAKALNQKDGIEINYKGYEVCATYPEDEDTNNYFVMSATEGKELIVFHFDVNNVGTDTQNCNILDVGPMFRMIVNGNDRQNALSTLLMNDLATFNYDLESGSSTDTVVVLEEPIGYADSISSVSFLIKNGDEQSIIPIEE